MANKKQQMEGAALDAKILELREEMRAVRFAFSAPSVKNVKQTRTTRREIARLETMKRAQQSNTAAK